MRLSLISLNGSRLSIIAATACLTMLALVSCGRQTNGDGKARSEVAESAEPKSAIIDPALVTSEYREELTDFVAEALIYGSGHHVSAVYPHQSPNSHEEGLFNFDQLKRIDKYPVLSTVTIDVSMASEGARAIIAALENDGPTFMCFMPRHALSWTYQGKRVDALICFQCSHVYYLVDNKRVASTRTSEELRAFTDRVHRELGLIAFVDKELEADVWSKADAPALAQVKHYIGRGFGVDVPGISRRLADVLGEEAAVAYAKGGIVVYQLAVNPNDQPSPTMPRGYVKTMHNRKVINVSPLSRESVWTPERPELLLLLKIVGSGDDLSGLDEQYGEATKLAAPNFSIHFGDNATRWMLQFDSKDKKAELLRPDGTLERAYEVRTGLLATVTSLFQQK